MTEISLPAKMGDFSAHSRSHSLGEMTPNLDLSWTAFSLEPKFLWTSGRTKGLTAGHAAHPVS
jgi:hypothetical protein